MTAEHFPAAYSVLACDDLLEHVLSQFEIGRAPTCTFHSHSINDVYRVRAESSTYYLRVGANGWRDLSDIEAEVDLLSHLHAEGVPVGRPIATRGGEYITTIEAVEGRRHAVLFSAAEGKARDENDRWSYLCGQLAAQIHTSADRMPSLPNRLHLDREHLLHEPLRAIEPRMRERQKDYDTLVGIADQLAARSDELLPKIQPEYGVCHGDLLLDNVNFQDDGAGTVFDFDCSGIGWRAYDLAVYGWALAEMEWDRKAKANRTRRWNQYLKGYEEHRTLTDAEHEARKVFGPMRGIQLLGLHHGKSVREGGPGLDDGSLDSLLPHIKAWIDYYKVL